MTILDRIDQVTPEELARGVYHLLYAGTADFATYEKMKDRRLLPILNEIVQAGGRPSFAPGDLSKEQADQVTISAAHLLADVAAPDDEEAIQALMGALDHDNDRVKLAAATALGELDAAGAAGSVVAFTERMVARGEMGAVARLSRVLARIGGQEAKACLDAFVAQNRGAEDERVQHVLAEAETAMRTIDQRLA
jgi:hypothetical protein